MPVSVVSRVCSFVLNTRRQRVKRGCDFWPDLSAGHEFLHLKLESLLRVRQAYGFIAGFNVACTAGLLHMITREALRVVLDVENGEKSLYSAKYVFVRV